jgi:hypothetical protein
LGFIIVTFTVCCSEGYIKGDVKIPCKQVSLSLGAPLGNLEGIRLLGLFEKKRIVYPGSFLGPRGYEGIKSGDHL